MKKIIFILFFLFTCSNAWAEKSKEIEIECALCHIERLTKDNSLIEKQDILSSDMKMCYTCHDGSVSDSRNSIIAKGHTIITKQSPQTNISENLPLTKDKKIYCGTCHRPHGISKKKVEEPGFFRIPLESLCQSCHVNKAGEVAVTHLFKQKDEKETASKTKGCPACHIIHSAPETTTIVSQKGKPILCLTCHPDKDKLINTSHNLVNSAPGEKNILGKTAEESGICGACHSVHNGNSFMLWSKPLDPEKEKTATLLCATCHADNKCASKKQIGEIYHPVDINLVSTPQTQKRLTLSKNNTLSCTTCHDPHFDKKNFLRMENKQTELCIECHPEEKAVIGTKHDLSAVSTGAENKPSGQVQETGACAGCHLVHNAYDIKLWSRTIISKDDVISALCYSCHNENDIAKNKLIGNYYHPINVPILTLNLTSTLPLYTKDGIKLVSGNITCATCHNVHQWDPSNTEGGQATEEEGTGKNSFLRKTANFSSELCSDCHKKEGVIANSNHDMTRIAPYSLNIQNNKIEASGNCSACHLIHNASDSTKWARELPKEGILQNNLCQSCHNENGIAKESLVKEISHRINIRVNNSIPIRLPLYNSDGIVDRNGLITCLTCHDPHLWDPEYFTKTELQKSTREDIKKLEKEKFTDEQVDLAYIGEVAFIQGDYIYINLKENYDTEIGRIFVIIDEENVTITKIIVEKYNPYAKTFKAFAKILSPETIADIHEGDYIIDVNLFLKGKIVKGTGENSFLKISNKNSFLCLDCHPKEKSVLGTKHDLSIQAPAEKNIQDNTVLESGPCSGCHLVHNSINIFLSAKPPRGPNPDPASGICFACHVKEGIAPNKSIDYKWHHNSNYFQLENKPQLKKPVFPLPFFDTGTAVNFDLGIVSCATCHNVHQWDSSNAEIISQEEGDGQNSFLRVKNPANQICNECHTSPVKKIMTLLAFESAQALIPEYVSEWYEEEIPLTVEITSLANNQIINNPEQTIQGTISDTSLTVATLILNEDSLPVEVKEGSFSSIIKLKEGKNNLKMTITDKKSRIASSQLLNITLDSTPLNIISYVYPRPVKLSNEFKIKVVFNKTIDTNFPPVITLIGNGRVSPLVGKGGEIKSTSQTNDTYITPDILLDENMAGEITIVVSDARDPAGNIIKKVAEENFILKPERGFNLDKPDSIIIEEGNFTFSPQINIKFNITEAEEMMITEDVTFKASQWQAFKPVKTFPLSSSEGEKIIYFKFKDSAGNISAPVTKICTFILPQGKQNLPQIIDTNLVLTRENSPYYLRGEITVGRDVTLTIQPGVQLLFSELKKRQVADEKEISVTEKPALIVEGKLIARGEKDKEIEFDIQSASPQTGDWKGIIIKGVQENIFEFCKINFADIAVTLDKSKAVLTNSIFSKNNTAVSAANNSLLKIESSKIENNKNEGIILLNSSGSIIKNEIFENKTGIFCDDVSSPSIMNNYIMNNEIGINCQRGSSPQIANNTIMENTNIGLKIAFLSSPALVNNLIAKNKNEGIYLVESSPLIFKNLIRDNKTGILCEKFSRKFLIQNNSIFNNKEFNFYLKNFNNDLDVMNNWWGTDKPNFIELYFYDKNTDETLGQLIYKPILPAPILSESEAALALTDTQKPKIESVSIPKTARINPKFHIKFELNEPINPYIEPKLYIKNLSGGKNPVTSNNNWAFSDNKFSNNILTTPDIILDTTMSGENEVFIENIQDLSGNTIGLTKIGSFELKTNVGIENGEITKEKEINIILNNPQASEIQISENASFENIEWIRYTELLPFTLSGPAGNKQIYVRFKDGEGNISDPEKLMINYDNIAPEITNSILPEDIKTLRSFRIKLIFSETLDINTIPKIILVINNKDKIPVLEQGGYFASENGFNNIYFSSSIPLKDSLAGNIDFEIENVSDLAGNKMQTASLTGFIYDILPTEIKSALIKEGVYTNKKEIHILMSAIKASSMQISENPSFLESKWIKYSNNTPFVLSSASGQKQIYIRVRDEEGNISKTVTLNTNLDLTKPSVISYNYPNPVTLNSDLVISVIFDESLDTTIIPEVILISTGTENPLVSKGGSFSRSNTPTSLENDTYTTPPVSLSPGMGGAITIVVKNASDLAGNIMDIISEETFQLDTFPPILNNFSAEREYTKENTVNLIISSDDAEFIMLSTNEILDTTAEDLWRSYIDFAPFPLSEEQGRKKIYLRLQDQFGNISEPFKVEVIVDKTSPQNLFYKFQYNPENSSLTLSCVFNESMDISRNPQITFIGLGENTPKIPAGGTFSTSIIQNDTYTTPPVILKENMTGEIIIVINEAYDMAGNNISTTAKASFFYSPIFPIITATIPMEEIFTFTPWVNLYIYAYNAKYLTASEDPDFSNSPWVPFSERFSFNLSEPLGEKTIYFKFKDDNGNISYVSNIKIENIAPPKDFIQNSEKIEIVPQDTTTAREITIKTKFENYNYQKVSENPFFENARWEAKKSEFQYTLSPGYGEKIIYFWLRDEVGNYSDIFSKKIFLNVPTPSKASILQKVSEGITTTKEAVSSLPEKTIDITQKVINLPIEAVKKVTQAIIPSKTDTTVIQKTPDTTKTPPPEASLPAKGLEMAAALPEKTIDITQKVINLPIEAVKKVTQALIPLKTDTTASGPTAVPDKKQDTAGEPLYAPVVPKLPETSKQKPAETAAVNIEPMEITGTAKTVPAKESKTSKEPVLPLTEKTAGLLQEKPVETTTAKAETLKMTDTGVYKEPVSAETKKEEITKLVYVPPKKIKQIWTIEVASDKNKDWASNFSDKINKTDSRNYAYVKKVIINGMIWYTIRSGLFNDKKDAEKHGEKLKQQFEEIKEYNIVPIK
ncbi:MAG: cytochrome c3 family protein [bacterium]